MRSTPVVSAYWVSQGSGDLEQVRPHHCLSVAPSFLTLFSYWRNQNTRDISHSKVLGLLLCGVIFFPLPPTRTCALSCLIKVNFNSKASSRFKAKFSFDFLGVFPFHLWHGNTGHIKHNCPRFLTALTVKWAIGNALISLLALSSHG